MVRAFRLLKRFVLFFVGVLFAAIIGYYVTKYLEKHDLVDDTGIIWTHVMTWVDYLGLISQAVVLANILWPYGFCCGSLFGCLRASMANSSRKATAGR